MDVDEAVKEIEDSLERDENGGISPPPPEALEVLLKAFKDKNRYFLEDDIEIQQIDGDVFRITTPFLDEHNDYLEIYSTQESLYMIRTLFEYLEQQREALRKIAEGDFEFESRDMVVNQQASKIHAIKRTAREALNDE